MTHRSRADTLYAAPRPEVTPFAFDAAVSAVFEDMINRSVPGYQTVLGMLGVFARRHVQPGSTVYDLGCALGASTLVMQRALHDVDCRLVAVDSAPAMVAACRSHCSARGRPPVTVRCQDIRHTPVTDASLVVLNLTLQFLPPAERHPLLERIHAGLRPGGALVLVEKVCHEDPAVQDFHTELHHRFKKANGYSDLEISQKRAALEDVLVPETVERHVQRLRACGFREVRQWFSCLNFAALLAVR